MHTRKFIQHVIIGVTLLLLSAAPASAYTMEKIQVAARHDFVLQPGKQEVVLDPGQSITKFITITSRVPNESHFSINIEDLKGSDNPDQHVVLMGDVEGPYTLRDYLKPEVDEFTLNLGDRITIPIEITIPMDAEPGGHYGSVLISSDPFEVGGQARVVSRIGSIFLIRVTGDAKEGGALEDFRILEPKKIYSKGPFTFEMLFRNTGSVHLTPFGSIEITNTLGEVVGDLPVDAYFALPGSLRYRDVTWNRTRLFGKYTARLEMRAGSTNELYEEELTFWVLPSKMMLMVFGGVFIVVYLIHFVRTRFEFKRKS